NSNATIYILDETEMILKKVKKSQTDSENKICYNKESKPGISNLMCIYSLITNKSFDEIEVLYDGKGYGKFKNDVAELVIDEIRPIQENYFVIMKSDDLYEVLTVCAAKASKKASQSLSKI